ncbi:MAG TPA: hypothetical protein VF062_13105 [Candidatus Limnocylindrales bacterium]
MFLPATPPAAPANPVSDKLTFGMMTLMTIIPMFSTKAQKIDETGECLRVAAGQMMESQENLAKIREQLRKVMSGQTADNAIKDMMILDGCFKTTNAKMDQLSTLLETVAQSVAKDQGRFNGVALAGEAKAIAQLLIPFMGKALATITSYIVLGVLAALLMKTKKGLDGAANTMNTGMTPEVSQAVSTAGDVAGGAGSGSLSGSTPTGGAMPAVTTTSNGQTLTPNVFNSGPGSSGWVAVDPNTQQPVGGGAGAGAGAGAVGGSRITIETRADGTVKVDMGQPDRDVSLQADIGGKKVDIKYDGDGDGKVGG